MAEDAITLIMRDHRAMEALFEQLTIGTGDRAQLTANLGAMLVAHSRAEEGKVYPELVKAAPGEKGEVHHGTEEHHQAEQILHRLERTDPGSPQFDAVLKELVDAVKHHVQEEEAEILPALRGAVSPQRLEELGKAFADHRAQELSGSGGTGTAPEDLTKAELYEEARKAGVEGRSKMVKDELAKAVQQAR